MERKFQEEKLGNAEEKRKWLRVSNEKLENGEQSLGRKSWKLKKKKKVPCVRRK